MTNIIVLQKEELQQIVKETAQHTAKLMMQQLKDTLKLQQPMTQHTEDKSSLITMKELSKELGIKEPTIRRMYKKEFNFENTYDPTFPKPHKIGNRIYWKRKEVDDWLNNHS